MATTERHLEISDHMIEQAKRELSAGDLLQASEKAWGAVVHYVKSVAQENGWPHETHRDIFQNVNRIIGNDLANDPRRRLLRSVRFLHVNFYEEELGSLEVKDGIEDAKSLIDALKNSG